MNTVGISRTRLHGPWLLIGRVTCAALIILSLELFVASIPVKLDDLTLGYTGIGITQNEAGEIVISSLPDLSAEQVGIQEGDVLVAIDGEPIQSGTSVEKVTTRLRGGIGTWVVLSVRNRGGLTYQYTLPRAQVQLGLSVDIDGFTRPYTLTHADDLPRILTPLGLSVNAYAWYIIVLESIQAVGFTLVSLVIFWRKSDDWFGLLISLTLVAFGVSSMTYVQPPWDSLAKWLYSLGSVFVLLCFYLLPDGRFIPRWTRVFGVCGVIWKGLYLLPVPFHPTSWPFPLSILLDLALHSIGVFTQVYRYRRVSSPAQRQQTKWVVLGLAIALVGAFVHILLGYASRLELVPWLMQSGRYLYLYLGFGLPVKVFALLVVPLTIGVSILRYRLWDIDFVINRSLVYGTLTAFLVVLFAGSLFVISQVFQALTGGQQSAIAIAASGVAFGILFQPTRHRLQGFVDRRFYGIQIDYQKTMSLPPSMTSSLTHPHFSAYAEMELVGRGGMGAVYKATHPSLNCLVAIKVLSEQLTQEANYRRRFEREAQSVAALEHPNIVRVFDSGEADGTCYIVMQYIAGPDLGGFLDERRRLPLEQALPLIQDIASALDYAHERGLVHRDIKPSNVMLDPATAAESQDVAYRAVLTDFGIAKTIGGGTRLTRTDMLLGTLSYIAPEQIQACSDVDGRADVYAFGVMAYEMLTGELPFKHQNPSALLIAHLTQPPPDPGELAPDLPGEVTRAVQRALAKRPEERYATAGEFADSLATRNQTGDNTEAKNASLI